MSDDLRALVQRLRDETGPEYATNELSKYHADLMDDAAAAIESLLARVEAAEADHARESESLMQAIEQVAAERARAEAAEAECARLRGDDPKRGIYWLTVAGREELRDMFDNHDDGNAVRPLLDALERAEAECARLRQDAERLGWMLESENRYHWATFESLSASAVIAAIDAAIAEGKHES